MPRDSARSSSSASWVWVIASASAARTASGLLSKRCWARPSSMARRTSRCWGPSWMSRSSRRSAAASAVTAATVCARAVSRSCSSPLIRRCSADASDSSACPSPAWTATHARVISGRVQQQQHADRGPEDEMPGRRPQPQAQGDVGRALTWPDPRASPSRSTLASVLLCTLAGDPGLRRPGRAGAGPLVPTCPRCTAARGLEPGTPPARRPSPPGGWPRCAGSNATSIDGPQQRLVRLAMELGRAQHCSTAGRRPSRRPSPTRSTQTQEALESAGPVAWHRPAGPGRPRPAEAVTALAALSTVPVELDTGSLDAGGWTRPSRRPRIRGRRGPDQRGQA